MDINIVKLKKYAAECSVLYVEDDELIRTQTASFLGRFFSDVILAEDGKLGLEKYKERNFDIVITDINMPNMNGIEMIEAIRDINYEQMTLITSAHNDSEYLMKLINLNVMHFVLKPFNNKQFLYVIYKLAEKLSFEREKQKLESDLLSLSKRSQTIVDQVHLGIVVLKDNKIDMANKAFLDIGGFDTFDTLVLEMPEIGVLFEEASHCIHSSTNAELVQELKEVGEGEKENSKVRIIKDSKTMEYQVILTELEDRNSYILTFSDITAIHNAMLREEHTQLPIKRFVLEKIELLKQKVSTLDVILLSIKHFDEIERWHGKKAAIKVETTFANNIKEIRDSVMPNAFIGYFKRNQLIVIPPESDYQNLHQKLKHINMNALNNLKKSDGSNIEVEFSVNIQLERLNTDKDMNKIEVDIISTFDLM